MPCRRRLTGSVVRTTRGQHGDDLFLATDRCEVGDLGANVGTGARVRRTDHEHLGSYSRRDIAFARRLHRALDDPLNLIARAEFAVALRAAGYSEDADQELRHLIALEPDFWFPYFVLGVNLAISGQWDESAELCERAYQMAPWFKPNVGFRAALLRRAGENAEAGRLFDSLTTDSH